MRFVNAVLLAAIAAVLVLSPSECSVRYSYAAVCGGDLCLLGADGKTILTLAKQHGTLPPSAEARYTYWNGLAVSPISGNIVASLHADYTSYDPPSDSGYSASFLYRIDPRNMHRRTMPIGTGCIPEGPVWLSGDVLLIEKMSEAGLDQGVHASNIRSGTSKQVVPARPDSEFFYDSLVPSPSGKLLLTTLGITNGCWLSVSDIPRGKGLWRTDPDDGMVGVAGAAWSYDDKWLYVAFCKDDEMAASSPGGVWRFDARTGKQYPWKYAKQSIDGIYSVPKQKLLVVERGRSIDVLRMTDGKLLRTLSGPETGGLLGAFSTNRDRWILCGSEFVVEMDASTRRLRTWRVRNLASSTVRYSPGRNALMFGGASEDGVSDDKAGVLDLRTGREIRFASNDWHVEWLLWDIAR